MPQFDALVVGAGFAGAVTARELAQRGGKRVLVVDRRSHIGGNAYDRPDESGVLIHQYGPHIFHTNDERVYDYLCRFTRFNGYQHKVVANVPTQEGRTLLPVPFNLVSLELAFGPDKAKALENKLIATYGAERKVTILELRRSPDPEIAALAEYVYNTVFVRYTQKQWGQKPEEIDPGTTARVPVFLSRDCRYFQDAYQGLPVGGYTDLFQRMLEHPNIRLLLGTPAREVLTLDEAGRTFLFGEEFTGPVVYTGAADELFDCRFGRLPYRTLDFQFERVEAEAFQTHGTVNYTADQDFTRITEFKHMTGQTLPHTTIVREYSLAYTGQPGQTPYYAIIAPENAALYDRYAGLAKTYPNLHLLGRLAEYQYYNMDAITAKALTLSDQLLGVSE